MRIEKIRSDKLPPAINTNPRMPILVFDIIIQKIEY